MNFKKTLLFSIIIAFALSACNTNKWIITEKKSSSIAIDESTDKIADKTYLQFLAPIKKDLDSQLNQVIGYAPEALNVKRPESSLPNLCADIFRETASNYTGEDIEIGIVNYGGLRTDIPEGDITKQKIFELMPFENELVIVWISGDKLYDLCRFFASVNGEGISGIKMGISQGKAIDIEINGKALDSNKLYSIATNDYLAGGNDGMVQLKMSDKKIETGQKIRDILIDYIIRETEKGNQITSKTEGRIYNK